MKFEKKVSLKFAIVLVFVAILVSSMIVYTFAVSPSSTFTISSGVYPGAPSYTVWREGSNYFAKDANGFIAYSGTNASYVTQLAINAGDSIYFQAGTYVLNTKVTISSSKKHLLGEGKGVQFTSDQLPCLEIIGGALDSGNSLVDVSLENLYFYYNGAVSSGNFIYVYGVQSDYKYQGAIIFRNINIRSSQTWIYPSGITTNENFVGLFMKEFVGVTFEDCNIAYFGTCMKFDGGLIESDMLFLRSVNLCFAKRGMSFINSTNRVFATLLKVMMCTQYGIYAYTQPRNLNLQSPQFESISTATCILFTEYQLTIENGMFSAFGIGIDFGVADVLAPSKHCVVKNSWFMTGTTAIYNRCNLIAEGNHYAISMTNKIINVGAYAKMKSILDDFVTENSGLATILNGQTSVIFAHGLEGSPTLVLLSPTHAEVVDAIWSWGAPGGLVNITITVPSAVTANRSISWYAEYKPTGV